MGNDSRVIYSDSMAKTPHLRRQYVRVCDCGCGQPTLIAPKSSTRNGWVKGQPQAMLHGHGGRRRTPDYLVTESGCWEWQGWRDKAGYGGTWRDGRTLRAHRAVWEQMQGRPIPDGLVLDHLCRNPPCVNPAHLEAVTSVENIKRGESSAGRAMRTGRCVRDHDLTDPANVHYAPSGQRVCRACDRARYYEKKAS